MRSINSGNLRSPTTPTDGTLRSAHRTRTRSGEEDPDHQRYRNRMNEQDLISNLGTIARSGTKNFVSQLSGDAKKDRTSSASSAWASTVPSWWPAGLKWCPAKPANNMPGAGRAMAPQASTSNPPSASLPVRQSSSTSTRKAHSTPIAGACNRSSRSTRTTSPSLFSLPTTRASGTKRRRSPIKTRITEQVNAASALGAVPRGTQGR